MIPRDKELTVCYSVTKTMNVGEEVASSKTNNISASQ
jgi:hypothetical protein